MARVYAPVSSSDLDALIREGRFTPPVAFAVTSRLASLLPDEDSEAHEHLATQFAAAASASDPVAVVALEMPDAGFDVRDASADSPAGFVAVAGGAPSRCVVCFLVADPGERVSDEADIELSWYDAAELETVRGLLAHTS